MGKVKYIVRWFKVNGPVYCIGYAFRLLITNRIERMRLKNNNCSIISQNCIGCVMLHDLGQPFNSPIVNLFMSSADYIVFLERLKEFIGQERTFIESDNKYPKGVL